MGVHSYSVVFGTYMRLYLVIGSTITRATLKTTLTLCRRTLRGERHRNANAWFYKLGTRPMAVDGTGGRRRGKGKGGEEPGMKHHIQPGCGEGVGWLRGDGKPSVRIDAAIGSSMFGDNTTIG